jgi:hypothetical protein
MAFGAGFIASFYFAGKEAKRILADTIIHQVKPETVAVKIEEYNKEDLLIRSTMYGREDHKWVSKGGVYTNPDILSQGS